MSKGNKKDRGPNHSQDVRAQKPGEPKPRARQGEFRGDGKEPFAAPLERVNLGRYQMSIGAPVYVPPEFSVSSPSLQEPVTSSAEKGFFDKFDQRVGRLLRHAVLLILPIYLGYSSFDNLVDGLKSGADSLEDWTAQQLNLTEEQVRELIYGSDEDDFGVVTEKPIEQPSVSTTRQPEEPEPGPGRWEQLKSTAADVARDAKRDLIVPLREEVVEPAPGFMYEEVVRPTPGLIQRAYAGFLRSSADSDGTHKSAGSWLGLTLSHLLLGYSFEQISRFLTRGRFSPLVSLANLNTRVLDFILRRKRRRSDPSSE